MLTRIRYPKISLKQLRTIPLHTWLRYPTLFTTITALVHSTFMVQRLEVQESNEVFRCDTTELEEATKKVTRSTGIS